MSSVSAPLFTILVPTRDRPEFVRLVVDALKAQTFHDFEVIVSDNAVHRPFAPDPQTFDGARFRYIRPPQPVWMADHWEFGVSHALGRYVGVLSDKSLLAPNALGRVARIVEEAAPDVVSWAYAGYMESGAEVTGRGTLYAGRPPYGDSLKLSPAEILDYLLAVYTAPRFPVNHQLETRGSIFHGMFSSALIAQVRARFGRLFRYYAPDLNSQCAAMQVARSVVHVPRPLEVRLAGPSNGFAMHRVQHVLQTQRDAARAGTSRPLIPGVSASNAHLLASDLVEISGRPLSHDRMVELYRRAAYDLYRAVDWPDHASRRAQLRALHQGAARTDPSLDRIIAAEKWKGRTARIKAEVMPRLRGALGTWVDGCWHRLSGKPTELVKLSFESVYAALAAVDAAH